LARSATAFGDGDKPFDDDDDDDASAVSSGSVFDDDGWLQMMERARDGARAMEPPDDAGLALLGASTSSKYIVSDALTFLALRGNGIGKQGRQLLRDAVAGREGFTLLFHE